MAESVEKARRRLQTLLTEIARADRLYYKENAPELSDFEYDCLQAEVKAIYKKFPQLEQAMKVGDDLSGRTVPILHLTPMLSLSNTYSKEELLEFDKRTREACGDCVYLLEPKVDGMAVNLIYENGRWVRALTRGDGRAGEDVTAAVQTIADIPHILSGVQKTSEGNGVAKEVKQGKMSSEILKENAGNCEKNTGNFGISSVFSPSNEQTPAVSSEPFFENTADAGENISQTAGSLNTLLPIASVPSIVEVRGEIYVTREDFEALNAEQERLGQPLFSNTRNLASGSVKLLDIEEVKRRRLRFVAHGIGKFNGDLPTQEAVRQWLKANNFPSFPTIDIAETAEEAWTFIEAFHAKEHPFPFVTDGVVLKVNDRRQQVQLGATAKFPHWAIAYKFEPESVETQVTGVTFQVGRTGAITPVAELTPVELCGSRISRATLHNFNEINRLGLQIGDWVVLQKAGEVIPAIVRVDTAQRSGTRPIVQPTACPACGAKLIRLEGEAALRCPSIACSAQTRLKIIHFASKEALDIGGMGAKLVDFLVRNGWVHTVADVFQLWRFRAQWLATEGFGETAVDGILTAIERAKAQPLWRWIYGLSLPNVGIEAAKRLAETFQTIEALQTASAEALRAVPLIGERTAQGIAAFFKNETNRNVLEQLRKAECFRQTPA